MTQLSGFLDVVLQGFALTGLATAVGGVAYALLVLRPLDQPSRLRVAALRRCLTLVAVGGLLLALAQGAILALQPLALADAGGAIPFRAFFSTAFARAGFVRIALATAHGGGQWC
ncbi:MAG: hypothetical protein ACE5NC_10850 [Anaerolineae bacterium]